jgi:hypothetical protein
MYTVFTYKVYAQKDNQSNYIYERQNPAVTIPFKK